MSYPLLIIYKIILLSFFSCRTAHRYSAAERIDGEGNIKCPECHAEAKGTAAKSQVAI